MLEDKDHLAQIFHDNARHAGNELLKLKISLSTAIIGIMVIVVTGDIIPPLGLMDLIFSLSSLLFAGLSTISGIYSWYADAGRYYFQAKLIQNKTIDPQLIENKKRFVKLRRKCDIIGTYSFVLAITCAIVYIFIRSINSYNKL